MSLTNAANYLASHGRNGDSMLVHMAPSEVAGLNAFAQQHGTQLTINPVTGLPEAFSLRKILRAAAPIALGIAMPYAIPGLTALGSGAIVGGLSTLRQMKVYNQKLGDSLMQGFMDGAAAWGGANMAQGWRTLGEQAAAQGGGSAASGVPGVGTSASERVGTVSTPPLYAPGMTTAPITPGGAVNPLSTAAQAPVPVPVTAPTVSSSFTLAPPSPPPAPVVPPAPATAPFPITNAAGTVPPAISAAAPASSAAPSTLSYAFQNPEKIIPAIPNAGKSALAVAVPFAQMAAEEAAQQQGIPSEMSKRKYLRYAKARVGRTQRDVAPYTPGVALPEQQYFDYQMDYGPLEEYTAASGGLMAAHNSLGSYSDGGRLLRGPGDGVSDDIPAQIDGDQPAKLADGEFVIPARDVAELGNGSTDAGARKLYAMLDRLEKSRRMAKRGQDMRPERHLPA